MEHVLNLVRGSTADDLSVLYIARVGLELRTHTASVSVSWLLSVLYIARVGLERARTMIRRAVITNFQSST